MGHELGNGRLPPAEVDALAADLRAGDVWQANEKHPNDPRATGMASLRFAAIRRGLITDEVDLVGFLNRIAVSDLERALRSRTLPPAPSTPAESAPDSSPAFVDTGE